MTRFDKHPDFIVRQPDPFNGGPPPERLAAGFVTANDLFFSRNHGGVPTVDREAYRLTVDGRVEQPLSLSLGDLRRFPRATALATLQCAGNRREEMMAYKPIPDELPWGTEAVSNAEWSGVRLSDVLAAAGLRPGDGHAAFTGLDDTERHGHRFNFGGSIPLHKALSGELLLADTMNGQPLPQVHGAPLRVVVPGYIGARSVKWLSRITVQEKPSDNYFQAKAYRLFPASFNKDNVDWDKGLMLGESPVTSVILSPEEKTTVPAGKVTVRGWSLAGGDRSIARVDVSADGGETWTVAGFVQGEGAFVWRTWEAVLDLKPGAREIVCRAFDTAAQTQPDAAAQVWNFKGYANNSWHRVRVTAQ
ncbi:MAG TPA: molybdopterin-dependent oxidoreductase [Thermoanaerobaculia bacterium]|nr:molybdopterin-dependent oxidoreductase [Thermoanaerobaculia bacterium]